MWLLDLLEFSTGQLWGRNLFEIVAFETTEGTSDELCPFLQHVSSEAPTLSPTHSPTTKSPATLSPTSVPTTASPVPCHTCLHTNKPDLTRDELASIIYSDACLKVDGNIPNLVSVSLVYRGSQTTPVVASISHASCSACDNLRYGDEIVLSSISQFSIDIVVSTAPESHSVLDLSCTQPLYVGMFVPGGIFQVSSFETDVMASTSLCHEPENALVGTGTGTLAHTARQSQGLSDSAATVSMIVVAIVMVVVLIAVITIKKKIAQSQVRCCMRCALSVTTLRGFMDEEVLIQS